MNSEAIGSAMMNSFWWITGLALVAGLILRFASGLAPSARYLLLLAALALVPLAFVFGLQPASAPSAVPLAGPQWAGPLGGLWLTGVVLLSLRTVGGWFYLRLIIRRAAVINWPPVPSLCRRIGLPGPVEVRVTRRAGSPFTAGWRHPVVVLPLSALTGLSASQLEAIFLHELAHIRRMDYAAEWLLQIIETLFFYHPAVWWLTAMARQERESSCDDMAIAAGAGRAAFARALVELNELHIPAPALSWAGGDLSARISRILGVRRRSPVWPVVLLAVLGVIGQVAGPWQKWVSEDVAVIIKPEEKKAFLSLRTDAERARFVEQFWKRRDPTPATDRNEAKEEHYRRIAYANSRFRAGDLAGWKSDRGATYIRFGPPDELESHPAAAGKPGSEKWLYRSLPEIGKDVIVEFIDPAGNGVYRMTMDPKGK